jgi:hypothetical protein
VARLGGGAVFSPPDGVRSSGTTKGENMYIGGGVLALILIIVLLIWIL